jgi:hypothetical protein
MPKRLFFVDTEASGPSPFSSKMTEFGVVEYRTRQTFYAHLYDFTPHPDTPALPVLTGKPMKPRIEVSAGSGPETLDSLRAVYARLVEWVYDFGDGNGTFVSDNPAFDWQWMSYGLDEAGFANPFGMSARRIGDLAAGLKGNWRETSSWKRYRRTKHTHNPVDDAMGNAEAFATILERHNQKV